MKPVHRVSDWANFLSYLAIPTCGAAFGFLTAFGFLALPPSLLDVFDGNFEFLWAQLWFWSCAFVVVGLIVKRARATNLYIWFEYPGLIIMAISAFVYATALLVSLDLGSSSLVVSAFLGIGFRFLFRWIEVHLLLMDTLRGTNTDQYE